MIAENDLLLDGWKKYQGKPRDIFDIYAPYTHPDYFGRYSLEGAEIAIKERFRIKSIFRQLVFKF